MNNMKQDFKYYGMKKIFQYNANLSVFLYHYYFTFEHNKEIIEWHITIENDKNAGIKNHMLEIINEIFTLQNMNLINLIRGYIDKFNMENRKWLNEKDK